MKNKIKDNQKLKRILIAAGTLALAAIITLAWFSVTAGPLAETFNLSNFDAEADYYFSVGGSRVEATAYLDSETNAVKLSLDSTAQNYIGNFRTDIKYKGKGSGYLRTKVVTEFDSGSSATLATSNVPYVVNAVYDEATGGNQAAWFDNRNADFCYYYATVLSGTNSFQTLNLISGIAEQDEEGNFDMETLREYSINLSVAVEADMVQINRYPQFWDIDTLPWKS